MSDEEKIYSVATLVFTGNELVLAVDMYKCDSLEEANEIAMHELKNAYPARAGWYGHTISAMEYREQDWADLEKAEDQP